ncbi:MAG: hypothetical protein NTZ67_09305 [Gammaproteobacteria bacterium]|nr:hypothetical protein [Gammaproteobacteria bacterium]
MKIKKLFGLLGPGIITGAADDDPSGITTYSQAGAQFGYGLLWMALLCRSLQLPYYFNLAFDPLRLTR